MSFVSKIRDTLNFALSTQKPHSTHPVMQSFLATPKLGKNASLNQTALMVADLEMTGLDANIDKVVSLGWVVIENLKIVHASARHIYVNDLDVDLDLSAPIHKISHAHLATGLNLESAFNEFFIDLKGKALVLHHAPIDISFLNAACNSLYDCKATPLIIDTMEIERRRLKLKGTLETSSLRLADCRARYALPQYQAHNAAVDALATAELLLAQIAHDGNSDKLKLTDYLS